MSDERGFGDDMSKWLICKRSGIWTICPPRPRSDAAERIYRRVNPLHATGERAFAEFRKACADAAEVDDAFRAAYEAEKPRWGALMVRLEGAG